MRVREIVAFVAIALPLVGCGAGVGASGDEPGATATTEGELTTAETFETGSKGAYATGDVALATGTWTFDDALIGSLATDVKDGAKAARLHNAGRITMGFDVPSAGTVTVAHASYGSDASATFGLFSSVDHGATWTQVGSTITTASGALKTAKFTVNEARAVRFELRKLDGAATRIDLDDVTIDTAVDDAGTDSGTDAGTDSGHDAGDAGSGDDGGNGNDGGDGGDDVGDAGAALSVHTTLGIPSAPSTSKVSDFLSVKSQYVLSFDGDRKIPNWVSWELNASYLGSQGRSSDFRQDDTFPANIPQATLSDYASSGYDRGHMCPSGDRTLTVTANEQTYYLTNMVPQAINNNRGPWERLEEYARSLASAGKEVFVVAGAVVTSSSPKTVGQGVVVPDATFKVVTVLDHTGQGPADVTASTRVIAISIPNDDSKVSSTDDWKPYRVSVRSIEAATGFDFLSDVRPSVQDVVETRVDDQ